MESEEERTQNEGDENHAGHAGKIANAGRPNGKHSAPGDAVETNGDSSRRDMAKGTQPTVMLTSPSPQAGGSGTLGGSSHVSVRPEALTAEVYDIVPTIAAPQSTSINTVTATPDLRWVFSGGSDGYVRKFNWIDTANGKLMLTVAQRHPFVDSVTKAGILTSYWENEDPQGMQSSTRLLTSIVSSTNLSQPSRMKTATP